ncbi:hypothetical protein D3C74_321340 [compost metagenome]
MKQQAEAPGITAQVRAGLSQQADALRGRLQALGIDPSQYGADVGYNNASRANAGIRTLAGQQLDLQREGQSFDQRFTQEQFAYQKARDAISDQQWRMQFDEAVRQNGLSYGLQMLQERNQQAYREAQLALAQDDADRAWLTLEQQSTGGATPEYNGMSPTQVLDAARQRFAVQTADGRTVIPQDATTKDKVYQYVASMGLPIGQDDQVMLSLGLSTQDIQSFDKKYGVNASGK